MVKVLVVTLFCGENEFEQCCESVKQQERVETHHVVIKNLPKQQAHQTLFQLFNDSREEFDYFAKLDADMAFTRPDALARIISRFDEGVDIVSATVHDAITDSDMQSFNVFSNRCYFHFNSNDPLFTDNLRKDYPGQHISYVDHDRNVRHAFRPDPFQAFMFGVHRAMKVLQPGERVPRINSSFHQKRILHQAYENYSRTAFEPAKYALWGASLVFNRVIKDPALVQKSDYAELFEDCLDKGDLNIDGRLKDKSLLSLMRVVGFSRFCFAGLAHALRTIQKYPPWKKKP